MSTPPSVRQLAETYYGPLEPTPGLGERVRPQEPPQMSERRLTFSDPRVAQPYVIRSYLAPERDPGAQQEAAALTMLAELLGGNGATSVLGQKLQFETQDAIYTSAFYDGLNYDDATFGLVIVPVPGVPLAEAEANLDAAIAEFIAEGIDPEQFDRIKMQMRASLIYGEDSISSLARRYGASLTSGLTVQDVEDWPDILQAVTPEDVMAAAEAVFDRDRAVTGWLMTSDAPEVTQ